MTDFGQSLGALAPEAARLQGLTDLLTLRA